MPFDADDKRMSKTRSEMLITQRIGNVVSHQEDGIATYDNTYIIDKTVKPAVWSILVGLQSKKTLHKIPENEVEKRKAKRRTFKPKKIDWEALSQHRSEIGRLGEEFVLRYETNEVFEFAPSDLERVIHLSEEQGDGAGFDIISIDENGNDKFIEVKTTQNGVDTPFYMTENEREYFRINQNENNLFVYRVYDFDKTLSIPTGKIQVISAKELFTHYSFDPISYKVSIINKKS